MAVLSTIVSAILLVIIIVGFPTVMTIMGGMIVTPFLDAQRRDRELAATSPAEHRPHLELVKSVDVDNTHNAA